MNLFNIDYKKYTTKGEKVLKLTGADWKQQIFGSLLYILFVFFIMIPFICFVGSFGRCDMSIFLSSKILISNATYTLLCWIFLIITYKFAKYAITNEGVYYTQGWLFRSFVPYNKIAKVKIHRNILDKIFNTGSLKIYTSYKTTVRLIYIKDYKKVNDLINKRIK